MPKLWSLYPKKEQFKADGIWNFIWGKTIGIIIRAETELEAREWAAKNTSYEDYPENQINPWLDSSITVCNELTADGKRGIVLRSEIN